MDEYIWKSGPGVEDIGLTPYIRLAENKNLINFTKKYQENIEYINTENDIDKLKKVLEILKIQIYNKEVGKCVFCSKELLCYDGRMYGTFYQVYAEDPLEDINNCKLYKDMKTWESLLIKKIETLTKN